MRILLATDAWAPQVNGVVQTLGEVVQHLRSQGHEVKVIHPGLFKTVPCPSYKEIRLALWPWARIRQELLHFRPQAVHVATEGPIGLSTRCLAIRMKMPFTTAYHTQFPEYVKARTGIPVGWTAAVLRWFHRPAKAVMVPTQTVIQTLERRGMANCVLWQRGVDLSLFNPQPSLARQHLAYSPKNLANDDSKQLEIIRQLDASAIEKPVFLYAGRVAVEKNLPAFLELNLPGEKWIAGDGPARRALQKRFPNARWFGMLNHAALSELYKHADVFVFPSQTDTFGLVMLEAMASGCPVAAFPVPGPLDVVGDSAAGILDWDLKAAALKALSIDKDTTRRHASRFTWSQCAQQFLEHLAPIEQNVAQGATRGQTKLASPKRT